MYEMPLFLCLEFGGWGFVVVESIFGIWVLGVGILSLSFCSRSDRTTLETSDY